MAKRWYVWLVVIGSVVSASAGAFASFVFFLEPVPMHWGPDCSNRYNLAWHASWLRARVYRRKDCPEADRDRCPYVLSDQARHAASSELWQLQLIWPLRIDLPDADLQGEDLKSLHALSRIQDIGCTASAGRGEFDFANLERAALQATNLEGASLTHARMAGAHLERSRLSGTVLEGADLRGAWLQDADLRGAQLGHADLTNARGLTDAQLAAALGDRETRLPEGLARPPQWP